MYNCRCPCHRDADDPGPRKMSTPIDFSEASVIHTLTACTRCLEFHETVLRRLARGYIDHSLDDDHSIPPER